MGAFLFLPILGFFLLFLLFLLFFQLGRQQALLHLDGMAFNVSAELYGIRAALPGSTNTTCMGSPHLQRKGLEAFPDFFVTVKMHLAA